MSLEKIMSKPVVSVELDDPLSVIREIFDNTRFHHVVVLEESGKVFGVISDRDLLKAISPYVGTPSESARDTNTLNKKAHQIMSRKPITIHPDASVFDVIELLNVHNISCVPVVDEQQRPVGMISWRDILRALASSRGGREAV